MIRIGQGFDAHAWGAGHGVTLGGVHIPYKHSLVAHSDGDVLVHALCDALLGASSMGDLGSYFPPDTVAAGCDSRILLRRLAQQLQQKGWRFIHLDSTIVAQQPMLRPFIPKMQQHIAADLQCATSCVSIKATTTDGLGFTGRAEGIMAMAMVTLDGDA